MYRTQIAHEIIRRNSPRPKGTTVGRNASTNNSKNVSRTQSDVEDDFEREMNVFVGKLMSGTSTPRNTEDNAKLTEEYDAAVMKYVNKAAAATETKKTISYHVNYEILNMDRRHTSQSLRQSALERICSQLAAKYDPTMFKFADIETLENAFSTGRTQQEIALALKALTLLAALNIDESTEFIQSKVLSAAFKVFSDEDRDPIFRASVVTSYGLLQTFINTGSQGFGLEDKVTALLDIANSSSTSPDQYVLTCSALMALGLILSAIRARNNLIEQILPEITELIKSSNGEVINTTGKIISLLYELYDFSDQFDEKTEFSESDQGFGGYRFEIPTVDNKDLIYEIGGMVDTSSSHLSKNIKQEQRSIFRKVLAFLEVRLQLIDPSKAQTEEGRLLAIDESIAHIRLSRAKALPINTWGQLVLSGSLKWLYENSLSSHLANNPLIVDLIKELGPADHPDHQISAEAAYGLNLEAEYQDTAAAHELSDRKRDDAIKKNRDVKQAMLQGED